MKTAKEMKELAESQIDNYISSTENAILDRAKLGSSSLVYDFDENIDVSLLNKIDNILLEAGYKVAVYSTYRYSISW